jgi:hypothetical protein
MMIKGEGGVQQTLLSFAYWKNTIKLTSSIINHRLFTIFAIKGRITNNLNLGLV